MHLYRDNIYQSEQGKVFQLKGADIPLDTLILIGVGDSINNYEEIDKPIEKDEL
jgi:hypothetical protein